jgi:WhiB family redox-sensing transcriptional regulator
VPDVLGTARPPGAQIWRWEWQVFARCRGRDDLFFHPHGERDPERSEREAAAKQVCAGCPVKRECLDHALQSVEPYGVWGGLSEGEREALLYGPRPVRKR